MNSPKTNEIDYIHFLIAAQNAFTCAEAARSQPESLDPPARDAFTRPPKRKPPEAKLSILQKAVRRYLAEPLYLLNATA